MVVIRKSIVMIDIDTNGGRRILALVRVGLDTTLWVRCPNIHVALVSVPTEPLAISRRQRSERNDRRFTQWHCLQNGGSIRIGQEWQILLLRRCT